MTRSAEARGATVEEATARALAALGVAAHEATVEVVNEGRRSLFGAGRRFVVRATTREPGGQDPEQFEGGDAGAAGATSRAAAPPSDRHEEEEMAGTNSTTEPEERLESDDHATPEPEPEELSPEEIMDRLDEEADLAADFVEGLLDRLDLPGDIEIEVHEEQALLNLQDVGSGLLIGRRGATLDALQELVRCAVQRQTERRSHVRVDVEGYRARQVEKLRDKCREAIALVRESGEPVRLEPMDAYERKMMHDLVAKTGGVTSSSEGSEPKRRVVIHPAE